MQSSLGANCPSEEDVSQGIPADRGLLLQAEPRDSWDMERIFWSLPRVHHMKEFCEQSLRKGSVMTKKEGFQYTISAERVGRFFFLLVFIGTISSEERIIPVRAVLRKDCRRGMNSDSSTLNTQVCQISVLIKHFITPLSFLLATTYFSY